MTVLATVPVLVPPARSSGLDRLRGLASGLMLLDHFLDVEAVGRPLRLTVTRAAMPLFMLLAGHLSRRRPGLRHCWLAAVGLLLPAVVPWLDSPNILVLYSVAGWLVWAVRGRPAATAVVMAVCLTLLANHLLVLPGSYPLASVVALMLLGASIPRARLAGWGGRLPAWLAGVGRFPLSFYVGHLLVLQGLLTIGVLR